MIEFPEAKIISKQLDEVLRGKKIIKVKANATPHKFAWFFKNPEDYPTLLEGKTVNWVSCIASIVDMDLGDTDIIFAEGLNFQYFKNDEEVPFKHQLLLKFDDESSLVCTIRMYGGMWAVPKDRYNELDAWLVNRIEESKGFPDLVSDEFTMDYFINVINNIKGNETVKAALATKNRIPGLGNGILQDILLRARIHPKRRLSSLTEEEKFNLYNAIKGIIREMLDEGGRDTETDIYNNKGGFITVNTRFRNEAKCHQCSDSIVKEQFMGGSIYFCPSCQKYSK